MTISLPSIHRNDQLEIIKSQVECQSEENRKIVEKITQVEEVMEAKIR